RDLVRARPGHDHLLFGPRPGGRRLVAPGLSLYGLRGHPPGAIQRHAGRNGKAPLPGAASPAAGGTLATYYWFSQTPLYTQTAIADLPWPDMMKVLMGALSILMITNVPYPAFPKVGVRSWSGLGGLVVVVGSICGIFIYGREFFFPAGMAYVLYGLTKTFVLGLVDRIPTGRAMDDERGDDDEETLVTRRGRDVVVGRRRRQHRIRRGTLPTPGAGLRTSDTDDARDA